MVKLILVANNYNQPIVDFRRHPQITPQDIIVRIGKAFMIGGDRTDMFFIREQQSGYTGVDNQWRIKNEILRSSAKYYAINASPNLDKILRANQAIDRSFHFKEIVSSVDSAKKYKLKSPSSGLVVLEYLLKKFPPPHQIYINNFSWEGWQGHDWEKEKNIFAEYVKRKKILIYVPSNQKKTIQRPLQLPIQKQSQHPSASKTIQRPPASKTIQRPPASNPIQRPPASNPIQRPIERIPQPPTSKSISTGVRKYRIPNGVMRKNRASA